MSGEARNLKDDANEHPEMHGHMPHEQGPLNGQMDFEVMPKGAGVRDPPLITYRKRVPDSVKQNRGKRPKLTYCNAPNYKEVPFSEPEMISIPGGDKILEPVGYNCWVCERDLMERTLGDTHSNAPPSTVVLACGHTFHTLCFMNNVPEGQEEDPPCIPCSMK